MRYVPRRKGQKKRQYVDDIVGRLIVRFAVPLSYLTWIMMRSRDYETPREWRIDAVEWPIDGAGVKVKILSRFMALMTSVV
jgi:hypothetical protein